GSHVAAAAIRAAGGRYGKRAVVVCGKGNNGGDGFVAARVLAAAGMRVRCFAVADVERMAGAAGENLETWRAAGGTVERLDPAAFEVADVVIDAIFGTGFSGRPEGDAARAIELINDCSAPVVAVDIPSGIDGATGAIEGTSVRADTTTTMGAIKVGLAIGAGAAAAGRIEIADIGIPITEVPPLALVETSDVARRLPRRPPDAHKRSSGTVAVLAGSDQMTGAAVLAVRGALRMGAGYANLGCTENVRVVAAARLPEALTQVVSDGPVLGPEALERFKGMLERADALAVGPGIGTGTDQRELVERILREVEVPVVADADALNVLVDSPDAMRDREAPLIITPHPAELARLLRRSTDDIQADRIGAATEAASRFGCVTTLKGFRTVVAEPSARGAVIPTGGPELATAGTGDVLTGAVAALVAAGLDPFDAGWVAAFVHGAAGSIAASDLSAGGLVAWDVAESLPRAVAAIEGGAEWD
ncbi:MAG: NAD(P)H-hydrate dehydratase, partial [Actinomycetota bacterium]|nr:NAD(P)H-hydrate dehydratase [Actinomycetota bacterium]